MIEGMEEGGYERAAKNSQRKREADIIVIAPGVTAGKLRSFRVALVCSLPGSPKRRRLRQERCVMIFVPSESFQAPTFLEVIFTAKPIFSPSK